MPGSSSVSSGRHRVEVEALRAALVEGEGSGEPQPFDVEAFLKAKRTGAAG